MNRSDKKIYLDYAATTPLDARVLRAMKPYFTEKFGNPGSLHSFGQEAMGAVDKSREAVAKTFGADFRDVIFAGSATEANNMVLKGTIAELRRQARGQTRTEDGIKNYELGIRNGRSGHLIHNSPFIIPRIIISAIEHESVLKTAQDLEREGLIELKILPVDEKGIVKISALKRLLNGNTVLVSVMYANNEMGAIQPVLEIGKIVSDFKKQIADGTGQRVNSRGQIANSKGDSHKPLAISLWPAFHTDAVQALQYLDCRPSELGVDFMTISGHKIYGPKGIGALVARQHIAYSKWQIANSEEHGAKNYKPLAISHTLLAPLIAGGGQEFGLRSGTENMANIVGLAEALRISERIKQEETKRIAGLRNYFWEKIVLINRRARLNGPDIRGGGKSARLPNNINVYLPGVLAEEALTYLDMQGIAVSAGSACSARASEPSHVLRAMFGDDKIAKHSLRITLGRTSDKKQIDIALGAIGKLIKSAC